MKKSLLAILVTLTGFLFTTTGHAQSNLVADQNPNFAISRDKYMKVADSLNAWHSTTLQENYKAIDWLADRQEARADRREFRRQLRLLRTQGYYDAYPYDYYPSGSYNRGYYNNGYYNNNRYYRNRYNRSPFYSPRSFWYWFR